MFGQADDLVEGLVNLGQVPQPVGSRWRQLFVVQQPDERGDVVAAAHLREHGNGRLGRETRHPHRADRNLFEPGGLDLGGPAHPGFHPFGEQVEQGFLFGMPPGQQPGEFPGLVGAERQRRYTGGRAPGGLFPVLCKHTFIPG